MRTRRTGVRLLAGLLLSALLAPLAVVASAGPSSAEVFPSIPRYVRSIGGQGRPGVFAWGVQWNPVTNEMLVADYLHFKIRRYDMNGNHLGDFWRDEPFGQPYTIGVDPSDGAIYVAELKDNPLTTGIAKYDKAGNFLYAAVGAYNTPPEREIWNDGVITAGSTTLTSATARFSSSDVGKKVEAVGIPTGTTITRARRPRPPCRRPPRPRTPRSRSSSTPSRSPPSRPRTARSPRSAPSTRSG